MHACVYGAIGVSTSSVNCGARLHPHSACIVCIYNMHAYYCMHTMHG